MRLGEYEGEISVPEKDLTEEAPAPGQTPVPVSPEEESVGA